MDIMDGDKSAMAADDYSHQSSAISIHHLNFRRASQEPLSIQEGGVNFKDLAAKRA